MSDELVVILVCIGLGAGAGLALDAFGLIVLVVLPTLAAFAVAVGMSRTSLAWYVYPAAWVAQQAAYLVTRLSFHPKAGRAPILRVRIMLDR